MDNRKVKTNDTPKGFYFIENIVDEWHSSETGCFKTLKEAKEALKSCSDWWCSEGTGCIYFRPYGLNKSSKFICRGRGLDEKGNLILVEKEY